MVVVGCEVVGVGLVDLEVLVLEINSSFRGYYCLELGGVEEWTSSEVNMVDVTGAKADDVFWVKSRRSIIASPSLTLTSKISYITSVMVEVS